LFGPRILTCPVDRIIRNSSAGGSDERVERAALGESALVAARCRGQRLSALLSTLRAHRTAALELDRLLEISTMSGYPTISDDLARAKAILARVNDGYQFHPKDEGDATKLLESFVAEIEDYRQSFELYYKASTTLMEAYKRAHPEVPENLWPDASRVNLWAAAEIERLRADALRPEYQLDYTQAKPNRYVDAVGTTGGKVTIERLNPMSLGELRRIVAAHGITRVRAALDEIEHD
jgi:hypothetical protein